MEPNFIQIVTDMSGDAFAEVIKASPRKIRETLFGRMGIKAKKKIGVRVHGKLEDRTKKLHIKLKDASTPQEGELCAELLRNWLYSKRELLCDTLDFLEIKHDNGLVEEEPDFFQELEKDKVTALIKHLKGKDHNVEAIGVYLKFVKTPFVDDVLNAA